MTNFRRSERYAFQLETRFKSEVKETPALTQDVSTHGVFIRTDETRTPNQLVKFSIVDPELRVALDLLGIVARCVPPDEATSRNPPGIGVSLFGNSRETEARWAAIIRRVKVWSEEGHLRPPGVPGPPAATPPAAEAAPRRLPPRANSQRPPAVAPPRPAQPTTPQSVPPPSAPPPSLGLGSIPLDAGPPPVVADAAPIDAVNRMHMRRPGRFNVTLRPEGLADLAHFEMRDISEGGTFVLTTQLLPIGSLVVLRLLHPVSGEAFHIPGQVVRAIDDIDPNEKGIGIRFDRGVIDQGDWDAYVRRNAPIKRPEPIVPAVRVLRGPTSGQGEDN